MASIFSDYLTRDEFVERYEAAKTKEFVTNSLSAFDKFCKAKYPGVDESDIYKQLRDANEDQRYLFLDKIVTFWASQKYSHSTIQVYFTYVKAWLRVQGIKTVNEEIKNYVKFPKKHKEIKKPLTVEMIRSMLDVCNKQYKAFFLVQVSSGMREGEALALRLSDLDLTKNPVQIHIRAETTKLKVERFTFMSSEAYNALQPFLKNKPQNERVFTMSQGVLQKYISGVRRKTGLTDMYTPANQSSTKSRRYHVNVHAFRSFFRTRASDIIGQEAAYFLLGQEGYLSQYYRLTEEDASEKYRQLEPYITISDENRLRTELEKRNQEIEKVDDVSTRLAKLEDYIKMMGEINSNQPHTGQN